MRVLRTALLVVAALAAVSVAAAVAAEPTGAEKAAIAAGKEAGAAAGAKAGNQTGAEAGKLAATGDFAEKMTPAQFKEMAAKNTGAALFFNDFDKDGNHHWSKAEFLPALRALIARNMLPAEYDAESNWEKLPRNIEGEVNFRDFVTWASTMKARPPPAAAAAAAAAAANKSQAAAAKPSDAKDCKSVFHKYDKDGSNTLDEAEFRASMQGRYDDSKLGAVYAELDRKGSKGTLAEDAFTTFCAKLTGMAKNADEAKKAAAAEQDPCSGDPCAKIENTVCRPDPKKCVKEPCPQFKCVEAEKQGPGNATAGAARSPYAKCVLLFDEWDNNSKDNQLTYPEFERGVARERAAGRMGNFPADRAWEALEHDGGTLDVYEFVHFCLAQSAGEQDPDTIDQECFEVFSHWDRNPRDLTLNGREFWKGMRRAKRQGHLPARVNVKRVWADLPKKDGEVEPGPFVDFCRAMSKGAEPEAAAKDTQAPEAVAPQTPALDAAAAKEVDEALKKAAAGGNKTAAEELAGGAAKVEYKPASSEGNSSESVDNVGHAAKAPADAFCTAAFHKADGNSDSHVTANEFKFACAEVAPAKACANYTQVFGAFDTDGKGYLSHVDFVRLCKVSGNRTAAGTVQLDSAYLKKLAAGADAGARAGARAGAEAGRQAGIKAGVAAAQKHHAEEKYNLASSSGEDQSSGSDSEDVSEDESSAPSSSSSGGDDGSASSSGAAATEESGSEIGSEESSESAAEESSGDGEGDASDASSDSTTDDAESSESEESSSEAGAAEESSEESSSEGQEADAGAAGSEESTSGDDAASSSDESSEAAGSTEESTDSEDSAVASDAVSGSEESVGDNTDESSTGEESSSGDDASEDSAASA